MNGRRSPVSMNSLLACLLYASLVHAGFQTLVGDLPKTVVAEKGPYLVTSDIFVPAGKVVTIEPGTVFLFKNFTGLHVQGTLLAKGVKSKPIVFSSENDKRFNPESTLLPNPYDWNGIFIHDDAIGTDLQHIEVDYSVYGINSLTKFIRIVEGMFKQNGRASLTIEGQAQNVTDAPLTYSLSVKNASVDGVPAKILRDPEAPKRNAIRYGGAGLLVAGAVAGAVFTVQWEASKRNYWDVSSHLNNDDGSEEVKEAQKSWNGNVALMTISYLAGLAGGCGFAYSFSF